MPKKKTLPTSKRKGKSITKRLITNPLTNKIIGLIFIFAALILISFPFHLPAPKQTNKNPIIINSKLLGTQITQNNPVRIIIPRADIDLPVVDAPIVSGYWQLSDTTASYGLGSGIPGQNGNTVIFAHARSGLFYNLKDVKLDDTVYVFTKAKWYRYKVNKITAVYPNQTEVIKPTKTQVLTLYTCTGFYDEKRLIVTAIPQK